MGNLSDKPLPAEPRYFGLAPLKTEGAPYHPQDIYIHCGCAKCEEKWQKQLAAYNAFYGKDA